jgi:ATP-dependent RNA helicase DeaD
MTPDPTEDSTTFAALGLRPELLRALSGLGYKEPTPIQRKGDSASAAGPRSGRAGGDRDREEAASALPVLERLSREAGRADPMAPGARLNDRTTSRISRTRIIAPI